MINIEQQSDWQIRPATPKPLIACIETVLLTAVGILLGHYFVADSVFFATNGFSWLIIGPLLSGLRYGFVYAIVSITLLLIALLLAQNNGLPWAAGSLASFGMGAVFIAFAVGEFRNLWGRKINRLYETSDYLNTRLDEVTAAFNLIKLSHDRMEQELSSDSSLRSRLLLVRKQLMQDNTDEANPLLKHGTLILKHLAEFGSIQDAELYPVENGKISSDPIASIGSQTPTDLNNALLQEALRKGQTISFKHELLMAEAEAPDLLLAVALVDIHDRVWGLVAVKKMTFRAFNADNIRDLAVIGEHIGNLFDLQTRMGQVNDVELQQFQLHLKQCIRNTHRHELPSTVAIIELTDISNAAKIKGLIKKQKRSLDQNWITINLAKQPVIFLLMPFTKQNGAEGYKQRLEQMVKTETSTADLKSAGINFHIHTLTRNDQLPELMKTLKGIANI